MIEGSRAIWVWTCHSQRLRRLGTGSRIDPALPRACRGCPARGSRQGRPLGSRAPRSGASAAALANVEREARGDGSRQLGQVRVLLSLQSIEILGAPPVDPLAPLKHQRRADRRYLKQELPQSARPFDAETYKDRNVIERVLCHL